VLFLWHLLLYVSENICFCFLFSLILSETVHDSASMASSFLQLLICISILIFISCIFHCFATFNNCSCTTCCCGLYPLYQFHFPSLVLSLVHLFRFQGVFIFLSVLAAFVFQTFVTASLYTMLFEVLPCTYHITSSSTVNLSLTVSCSASSPDICALCFFR
jgi:hypothetical protein